MSVILGIDAAWTERQPSGLALVVRQDNLWSLVALSASYGDFFGQSERSHAMPQANALLAEAKKRAGAEIDLVTIDMPLSTHPIVGRRVADNSVSKAYGGRKAGTHSPSALRPGALSDNLMAELADAGYPLLTQAISTPGTIEVYPHPALIELTGAAERLPYKYGKSLKYWPGTHMETRRKNLIDVWANIVEHLEAQISGVRAALPIISPANSAAEFKCFENMLDAIVCAWVGIEALEGRATPFGDDTAAIWVPNSR